MTQEPWTREDMAAFLKQYEVTGELNRIQSAGAWAESKWVPDARGDLRSDGFYCSRGFWQINICGGQGEGMVFRLIGIPPDRLDDPVVQIQIMKPPYQQWYNYWRDQGMVGEELCWRTCAWAERPYDHTNRDSLANIGYREGWRMAEPVEIEMAFDPDIPSIPQQNSWECSIATTTWLLRTIGRNVSLPAMRVVMQSAGLVTPADGLLVGSGGPLADWISDIYDVATGSKSPVSFQWIQERAGNMPFGIGGANWYHWVGVRGLNEDGSISIANPAEGYKGIYGRLSEFDYSHLGPFAAVWIEPPADQQEDDSTVNCAELQTLFDDLTERVAPKAKADVEQIRAYIETALSYRSMPKGARKLLQEALDGAVNAGALPAIQRIVDKGGE